MIDPGSNDSIGLSAPAFSRFIFLLSPSSTALLNCFSYSFKAGGFKVNWNFNFPDGSSPRLNKPELLFSDGGSHFPLPFSYAPTKQFFNSKAASLLSTAFSAAVRSY